MKKEKDRTPDNAGVGTSGILFCDFLCPHASFPKNEDVDGSRSCRTFAAVWCELKQEHVVKNAPCSVRFGKRRPKSTW